MSFNQGHHVHHQYASLAFKENVIEGKIDSDYLLYGLAQSYRVPNWQNAEQAKQCHHCKDPLKSGCTHNCRLCGSVFCSHCTAKYHLPEKFELKGKVGPTRVCYGCRMSCVRLKQASMGLPLDSNQRPLPPPQWQAMNTYVACNKCCIKRRGPHQCRGCGDLYCDDCSTKMNINLPPAFNPKGKSPPHRMCDSCRYRLASGARFDDGSYRLIEEYLKRQQQEQDDKARLEEEKREAERQLQQLRLNTSADLLHDPVGLRSDAQSPLAQGMSKKMMFDTIQNAHGQQQQPKRKNTSDVTKELAQVLGKMNIQEADDEEIPPPPPPVQPVQQQSQQPQQPQQQQQQTPQTKAIPLSALRPQQQDLAQHQLQQQPSPNDPRQLQRMKSGQYTPSTPNRVSVSSGSQLGNTPRMGPTSSIASDIINLNLNTTNNNNNNNNNGNGHGKKPVGARDMYRQLSTTSPITNFTHNVQAQNKLQEQSLDDQKEAESMEINPHQDVTTQDPRQPRLGGNTTQALVKPSELFKRK